MNFHFIGLDNFFYHTLYDGFNNEPNTLTVLPEKCNHSKIWNAFLGWKLPFPELRALLFYWAFRDKKYIDKKKYSNGLTNCFIVYGRTLEFYGPCLLLLLKRINPNAFFVCYLGDVASTYRFHINFIKKHFDEIFSCDIKDANSQGIKFLQEPYSIIINDTPTIQYDFCFIGNEKGRLKKIINIFENLSKRGYKCAFYINGVNKAEQKYTNLITYNNYLDYSEVIDIERKSRCIVEVLQEEADTTTTRYSEALLYRKYLLTDSTYLKNSKTKPPNIISIDYCNWDNIDKIKEKLSYDITYYQKMFSIDSMTKTIEKNLICD